MPTARNHPQSLRQASAQRRGTIIAVARFGWFAKGIVYLLAGALASTIAVRSLRLRADSGSAAEASPTGAIKELATFPGGRVLLISSCCRAGVLRSVAALHRARTGSYRCGEHGQTNRVSRERCLVPLFRAHRRGAWRGLRRTELTATKRLGSCRRDSWQVRVADGFLPCSVSRPLVRVSID